MIRPDATRTPTVDDPFGASRFDFKEPMPRAEDLGRVHYLAIGGSGMSGVARIMLARGVEVTGTDSKDIPVLKALASEGATVWVGFDPRHQEGADAIVMSSSIRDDNVELVAALARGIPVLHRAQGLATLMHGSRPVAVAGANGKTTTTSMLTVALQGCGLDPSFAIGGELAKHGTNAHHGTDDIFVVEADESDGSFMVYRPEVAIVTNVQADHLAFYENFDNLQAGYVEFVKTVRPGGLLVTCTDDAGVVRLENTARRLGVRVATYGFDSRADVVLSDHHQTGLTSGATVTDHGVEHELVLGVPGRHNALNAAAAYTACVHGLGLPPESVLAGLASFTGTRRRFEVKGEARGVVVVDDYAHNAGKVAAVVETGASLVQGKGRLIAVFQPMLYTRTRDFWREFGQGMAPADVSVVMDVYGSREDPIPGVSGQLIVDAVLETRPGAEVYYVTSWSEVPGVVAGLAGPGDLVITIGSGDITLMGPEILREIEGRDT